MLQSVTDFSNVASGYTFQNFKLQQENYRSVNRALFIDKSILHFRVQERTHINFQQ